MAVVGMRHLVVASSNTNHLPPGFLQHPDQLPAFHNASLYTPYTQGKNTREVHVQYSGA
jgi:hypothetical protein